MPTIKTKKRMNKKEYAQFLIDNAEIIEITASYRGEEKYEQNIKLEPNNNKTIPISKDILEIEIEEPITVHTNLDTLVEVRENGTVHTHYDTSIREEERDSTVEFHTLIDGKLVLIWDREEGLVE
ncbi:hypothetical protein [Mammaliicoccus sciuri]|uniref:hypothetical protein n=1 Tax=Mammaliicoccus sciuri TaxID=1296 RepID=UPI001FB3929E|nr:hypothetical protein [Mammaliicoccus sciuri]MCJ1783112.1 hypothetical protein [Mammaliicoccus sciuri]